MNYKTFFHYISYLQYPLMLVSLYFAFKPYLQGAEQLDPDVIFESLNSLLIFMGLAISFSSLQDTTKTQNKFSERIWKNPKKGKIMIALIGFQIFFLLGLGLVGFFVTKEGVLNQISIGFIVLSLGMFGFLKAAIEMFENHRTDKVE